MKTKNVFISFMASATLFTDPILAQVSYTSSDYAQPGDTFRLSKADSMIGFDFDTSGAGMTWDYSGLTPYTQVVEEVVTPNNAGYIFTPISFHNSLDQAEPTSDTVYIGSLELGNYYKFYVFNGNDYEQHAFAAQIEGTSIKTKYDSVDVLYRFPLEYGNSSDSSNSSYNFSVSSLIYYEHQQKRKNEITGFGSLKTPFGTFDAVKLKSIVTSTDTFAVSGYGVPTYSYTTIEYKWFSPSFGYPLLTVKKQLISGYTVSTTARYLDSVRYFTPSAGFVYFPETPVQGEKITFQNLSLNAESYLWNFDDTASGSANTSTLVNPTHSFSDTGHYTVTLIASTPQESDTATLKVWVSDSNSIIAYFTYIPQYPCLGDTITFFNSSYNASDYQWDFGDGTSFSGTDTSYKYSLAGTYKVSLIANKTGSSDTSYAEIKYAEIPTPAFTYSDSITNSPIVFTNTSVGVDSSTTYYWNFGYGADPSTSTLFDTTVTYNFKGDKTVYLIAYNSVGCYDTKYKTISVTDMVTLSSTVNTDNQITLFPLPIDKELTIQVAYVNQENLYWIIRDLNGRMLMSGKNLKQGANIIDTGKLSKGIYLISIYDIEDTFIQKIVKE